MSSKSVSFHTGHYIEKQNFADITHDVTHNNAEKTTKHNSKPQTDRPTT